MTTPIYERVGLVSVDLIALEARTSLMPAALPEQPPVLGIEADVESAFSDEDVVAVVTFRITGHVKGDPAPVFELLARYRLVYEVRDGEVDEASAEQLANVSGVFNAWPFFREVVAGMYSRMNLPLPLVPTISPSLAEAMPWQDREKKGKSRRKAAN